MLSLSLAQIIQWLITYKYFILFPVAVLEGPTITIVAGFLSSIGQLNFYLALLVVVLANLSSDSILYAVGRWGGGWWKYLGFKMGEISKVEDHFKKHKIKTLLVGKLALGVGNIALVAAGVARLPYLKYMVINILIEVPKSLVFLLVGFYFGRAYNIIDQYLKDATLFFIFGSILILLFYWLFRWWLGKKYEDL